MLNIVKYLLMLFSKTTSLNMEFIYIPCAEQQLKVKGSRKHHIATPDENNLVLEYSRIPCIKMR